MFCYNPIDHVLHKSEGFFAKRATLKSIKQNLPNIRLTISIFLEQLPDSPMNILQYGFVIHRMLQPPLEIRELVRVGLVYFVRL